MNDEKIFNELNKKLDKIIILMLLKSSLTLPEIERAVGISARTIQRMFPVKKIQSGGTKNE